MEGAKWQEREGGGKEGEGEGSMRGERERVVEATAALSMSSFSQVNLLQNEVRTEQMNPKGCAM